ncbi:MAG: hypothetical protein IKK58_00770 [Clostridia bacterium]|nr:hypothetical protein [Clostridia bacterium]
MGHILMILCVLFCIGVLVFVLSTDSKNVIVDEDGVITVEKNDEGLLHAEPADDGAGQPEQANIKQ